MSERPAKARKTAEGSSVMSHQDLKNPAREEKGSLKFVKIDCSTVNEAKALPEIDLWSTLPARVGRNLTVEAAGGAEDGDMKLVADNLGNGILQAFHMAYADHYPLSLTPDDIWICVAQAFAQVCSSFCLNGARR